jgi:hypothetical protein
MSYIILRGRWFQIIFPNVHAPTQDKIDDVKDSFYEELECVIDKFPKYSYHMIILLGDFSAKVGREDIFVLKIGTESLLETSNNNGVRVLNFSTSRNLMVRVQCSHIHKHVWT